MIQKSFAFLVLLTASSWSWGQDLKTFAGENYSIQYPATWELQQSGQPGVALVIMAPINTQGDQFRENVNLLNQDISSYGMDLKGFVTLSENQIRSMITDGEIIESTALDGYHKMVYKGTVGQFKLKFIQYYWVEKGIAYVLTFSAEQSEFDKYQAIGLQIMDSFELK